METYKSIKGHSNYAVSDIGNVMNVTSGRILKPGKSDGYCLVNLNKKTCLVHRLVAIAFIKNPLKKPIVDHINNVRSDNRVSNLRWATNPENGANSLLSKKNTSGYKGVRWDDIFKCWYVDLPYRSWGTRIYKTFNHVEDAVIFRFTMFVQKYGIFVNKAELIDYNSALEKVLIRVSHS